MPNGSRPDLDPVLRRAFMAPAIAEWTRVLGKPLIVSTTEDDDTAAANCAVEVVMAVDGAVRGKVTYTLAAQTVTSIASASGDGTEGGPEQDPLPAIDAFFKPIATRAREMLQSSGLGCTVSTVRVRDVRGHSYSSPVTSPRTVHMVTQPSHKDPTPPDPVSLWFDLETIMAPVAQTPQPVGAQQSQGRAPDEPAAAEPRRATITQPAPRAAGAQQPGTPPAAPAGGRGNPGGAPDSGDREKPGYTPILRTSRLEIVDESGTARAVVSTLADGSPHIVFADRDGRIRAAISLAKDGQPRILFLDEMGRRILDLPHAGSSTSQVASQPTPPRKPAAPQPPPPPPQTSGFRPGNPPQTPPQRRPDHPQAPHR
jgi:hypothetical protein